MSRFRDDRNIRDAFPNSTLDGISVEYLRETFDNISKKIDDARIRSRSDMERFISDNFKDGKLRSELLDRFNRENPRDVDDFKNFLINFILLALSDSLRNKRDIVLSDILETVTRNRPLFFSLSEYMPPSAFYNSVPKNDNTFGLDTMKRAIDTFNSNLPAGRRQVRFDPQGLDLLHDLLKTVVYAVKRYEARDRREIERIISDIPVGKANDNAVLEHKLTSKLFTLIIDKLSSENKNLYKRDLISTLPQLPKYDDISAFLIYPLNI